MKKILKTLICSILMTVLFTSSLAHAASYKAVEPTFDVLVDGERFYSEPPVIVIDGSTYLPLRALGNALGVYVEWNADLGQVEVSTTKPVVPKEPSVANAYKKFEDVPDPEKVVGVVSIAEESVSTDFGYVTSYGYEIPEEDIEYITTEYPDALSSSGYETYYYDDSLGYNTLMMLNASTGRLLNILVQGNVMVVSIFEKKHTPDEWELLDLGKALPTKEYNAVTAGFKVLVDGEEFASENPALVVDGRTYLPLRAMGDCLGVNVEWNAEIGRVEIEQ